MKIKMFKNWRRYFGIEKSRNRLLSYEEFRENMVNQLKIVYPEGFLFDDDYFVTHPNSEKGYSILVFYNGYLKNNLDKVSKMSNALTSSRWTKKKP